MDKEIHAVTGAFGYTGKYIAKRLIANNQKVITLTNSVSNNNIYGESVLVYPFNFNSPERLIESLKGVSVLYNTYWIRFNNPSFFGQDVVHNSLVLFDAARRAGVKHIVHISIANPQENSQLEYYRNKAKVEKALIDTGLFYSIIRPTIIFGKEDILINNIAWTLRYLPIFGLFGNGRYKIQPVYVDDVAKIAVECGVEKKNENTIINAIGPETFTYRELIETISRILGKKRFILSVPSSLSYFASCCLGKLLNDVIITRDELTALMANMLFVDSKSCCDTKLTEWATENAKTLGLSYRRSFVGTRG